ncbi:MAG: hypothetical protein GTO40_29405 [Deltaproteobacteria bacterium]|nr:hypothetical protein [Deltaproteobacteria bacterium]
MNWGKLSLIAIFITSLSSSGPLLDRAFGQSGKLPHAERARDFYKGKTITFTLSTSPGGTFDLIARLIAKDVRELAGAKVVIVRTDRRGRIAPVNAFARARRNPALNMFHLNGSVALWAQMVKGKGVNYDLTKFRWLSRSAPVGNVLLQRGNLPYRTFDDLKKADLIKLGGIGRFSTTPANYALMCANFDLKCRFVLGYRGSAPGVLALKKGEVEFYGAASTMTALREKKAIKKGELRIFAVTAPDRIDLFPKVPTWLELGGNEWKEPYRSWLDRMNTILFMGYTWVMPPGTPDYIVEFMRGVIKQVYSDPKILNVFEERIGPKRGVIEKFVGGVEVESQVKQLLGRPLDDKDVKWITGLVDKYVP